MTRSGPLTVVGFVAAVLAGLACLGFLVPAELLFTLAFGWVRYLARTLPQVSFDPPGLITAIASLAGLSIGLHLFARWWTRNVAAGNASLEQAADDGGPTLRVGQSATNGHDWPLRRTLALVAATVLLFVAGLAATGVAHQTAWLATSPEPLTEGSMHGLVGRTQSKNNLKQIGLAFHNYHDTYNVLPMAGTFDDRGRPHHGWMTSMLPFIESSPLPSNIDMRRPWDHPANAGLFFHVIPVYMIPRTKPERIGDDPLAPGAAHYSASSHLLGANHCTAFNEITDGTSNTLLAGEAAGNYKAWGDPTNVRDPVLGINATPDGFGGPWKGGANVLMGDGSVRLLSETIDPAALKALATPAAGDELTTGY